MHTSIRDRPLVQSPRPSAAVAVIAQTDDDNAFAAAASLAEKLGLPMARGGGRDRYDVVLAYRRGVLGAQDPRTPRVGPVSCDFAAHMARRRRGGGRELLARAVGRGRHRIVDATAGLGYDAVALACLGHEVIAFERSTAVFALLEDGLARARLEDGLPDGLRRLTVERADARAALAALAPPPDVVYLDPMFPPKRRKSSAPGKEMRLLRALVGNDEDIDELFALSRERARLRVVVKRADDAPMLAKPSASIRGKLVRYDLYIR